MKKLYTLFALLFSSLQHPEQKIRSAPSDRFVVVLRPLAVPQYGAGVIRGE